MRRTAIVAAAGLALVALDMCRPRPAHGAGPESAIVAAAAWAAWLAAAYLVAGLGLTAAAGCDRRVGRLLPFHLGLLLHRAIGAGAAAAVLGSGLAATAPAWADTHRPHPGSISATWPLAPQPRHTVRVVVEPGDCLWSLTAESLHHPGPARVAATWPRWWRANRDVIGANPDLIQPGQRLRPPHMPRRPT